MWLDILLLLFKRRLCQQWFFDEKERIFVMIFKIRNYIYSLVVVCTNHFLANSHVLYILSLPFFTCSSLMSQDCDVVLVAARAFWTTRSTPVQHFPRIPTVPYTLQFPSPAPEQEIDEQIRESGHKKKYSSLLGYQRYIRNKLKQIIFYFFLWCACINLLVDFKIKKITSRQLSWNINCVHRL